MIDDMLDDLFSISEVEKQYKGKRIQYYFKGQKDMLKKHIQQLTLLLNDKAREQSPQDAI